MFSCKLFLSTAKLDQRTVKLAAGSERKLIAYYRPNKPYLTTPATDSSFFPSHRNPHLLSVLRTIPMKRWFPEDL